jgi:hypothetical protein
MRRAPKAERDKYFAKVEKAREEASAKQKELWGWQTKAYKKGEDPLDEWKKRRANGQISDLNDQYGDPKKIGGIPLPSASFGVGGEFGVGGKYDNGMCKLYNIEPMMLVACWSLLSFLYFKVDDST